MASAHANKALNAAGPAVTVRVFRAPSYTQLPNEIIDELMSELSGSAFKVLCYIARRTFGFQRAYAVVSVAQMAGGLVTQDGRRLDWGTGLSVRAVQAAIGELEAAGLVVRRRNQTESGRDTATTYTILVQRGGDAGGYGGAMDETPVYGDDMTTPAGATAPTAATGTNTETTTCRGAEIAPLDVGAQKLHPYRGGMGAKIAPLTTRYKEEKERKLERKPPIVPRGDNARPNPTAIPRTCQRCGGSGALAVVQPWNEAVFTVDPVPVKTLGDVRRAAANVNGFTLCDCAMGVGWETLLQLDSTEVKGENNANV